MILESNGHAVALDEEDFPLIQSYRWSVYELGNGLFYARANGPVYMHRLIMGSPLGMEVDHRDGDGLNNRRANLRVATHALNLANQRKWSKPTASRYKGVSTHRSRWGAWIKVNGKSRQLGTFDTQEEAARAYDRAAVAAWGEFARLNFPE